MDTRTREQTPRPIPYSEKPDYPSFGELTGIAEDFRAGAERAYLKNDKWARYYRDPYLDILATYLQPDTYAFYAFPPAGFQVSDTQDIEQAERFRGYILRYRAEPHGWAILASSQELGEDEFNRVRDEIKAG